MNVYHAISQEALLNYIAGRLKLPYDKVFEQLNDNGLVVAPYENASVELHELEHFYSSGVSDYFTSQNESLEALLIIMRESNIKKLVILP